MEKLNNIKNLNNNTSLRNQNIYSEYFNIENVNPLNFNKNLLKNSFAHTQVLSPFAPEKSRFEEGVPRLF